MKAERLRGDLHRVAMETSTAICDEPTPWHAMNERAAGQPERGPAEATRSTPI